MRIAKITVRLNGTDRNLFHPLGLKQNPFPQVAVYELMPLQRKLASLAGDPIRDEEDLRSRLAGFEPSFIQGCVDRFRPGEVVSFDITFPY